MSLNLESPNTTRRAPSISISFETPAQRPSNDERGFSDAPTIHNKDHPGENTSDGGDGEDEDPEYWERTIPTDEAGKPSTDFARVLLIDIKRVNDEYVTSSVEFFGKREVHDAFALARDDNVILRIIHIQNLNSNSQKGLRALLKKYDIELEQSNGQGRDQGKSFSKFVALNKPRRLAGKPLYHAKAWKAQTDHERGIRRLTFGFDYMRLVAVEDSVNHEARTSQLMAYDEDENPTPSYNIYPQRCSVFVQKKISANDGPQKAVFPTLRDVSRFDNNNTIIIFDNAHNGNCDHTLIPMRKKQECKWRRLPHIYGPNLSDDDDKVVMTCLKTILNDIYYKVVGGWDFILDQSWEHVNILEDQIYEQPADETKAPELWNSSALWLKYDKLIYYHKECFLDAHASLKSSLFRNCPQFLPFPDINKNFARLENTLKDDLVKATANLSDLMYKSVEIRDSHHSLRLGASMWRLSWVTFVFLPLTFICGFFGMNVDIFDDPLPDVKWYFVTAVPFMVVVLASWYLLKEYFNRHQRRANERTAYTSLFPRLQVENPSLWTRTGPRQNVQLNSTWAKIKWKLINRWTREASVAASASSLANGQRSASTWGWDVEAQESENKDIGWWARRKTEMIRRWTRQLSSEIQHHDSQDALLGEDDSNGGGTHRFFGDRPLRLVQANTVERREGDGVRMFRFNTVNKPKNEERGETIKLHEVSRDAPDGKTVVMTRTFPALEMGMEEGESSRGGSPGMTDLKGEHLRPGTY